MANFKYFLYVLRRFVLSAMMSSDYWPPDQVLYASMRRAPGDAPGYTVHFQPEVNGEIYTSPLLNARPDDEGTFEDGTSIVPGKANPFVSGLTLEVIDLIINNDILEAICLE